MTIFGGENRDMVNIFVSMSNHNLSTGFKHSPRTMFKLIDRCPIR